MVPVVYLVTPIVVAIGREVIIEPKFFWSIK
jgi:hypothetical protein